MFIIEILYNFLYVWHCMEVFDKKFFINGKCMIRSFGQPALSVQCSGLKLLNQFCKIPGAILFSSQSRKR